VARRCRPLGVTGWAFVAPVAVLALAPLPGRAQSPIPDPSASLLNPSFSGSPNTPPRFGAPGAIVPGQAPPPGRFSSPSGIRAPPIYGSPTGFGAGNTGFDSSNRPRRRLAPGGVGAAIAPATTTFSPVPAPSYDVPSVPRPPQPPLRPEIYPRNAASRPGAALPPPPDLPPISNPPPVVYPASAASRPGASVPVPPPLDYGASASTPPPGTPLPNTLPLGAPSRALPIAGIDPYDPLGIRAGTFVILPSLDLSAGYNNNVGAAPNGPGSSTYVITPEVQVRSDWSRHSLTADISGSYFAYGNDAAFSPPLDRPYFNSKIDGTIDVTHETQILLENRVIVSTDSPGSPVIITLGNVTQLPLDTTVGETVGLAQQFNRFSYTLRGTFDRTTWQASDYPGGVTVSNDDRNYDQYAAILRVGYEFNPNFKPFVEVSADNRVHDQQLDDFGEDRDSTGKSAKVGLTFAKTGSLTGEIAVGYMERDYKDPTLPNIAGPTLDGSVTWQATALTTAKFTAATSISETPIQFVSGEFSRDFNIQVDHALRRWLIATVQAGYGIDEYAGLDRTDDRYFVMAGLTYKLNRDIWLKAQVRQDWRTSNASGGAYDATSFLLGLRLQR
jgi:hypothetical protein